MSPETPSPAPPAASPLHGLRVLDLTRIVAGPWCTQLLADLGADVIKIEKPRRGDDARHMGPFLSDEGAGALQSALFLSANRGKRSMELDFTAPEAGPLLQRLVDWCDVFVENHKVGSLRRYGLDWDTLRQRKPGLVYCSITGFGQDGPYAPRPGYDFIAQGMGGFMSSTGEADGPPVRAAPPISDLVTGMYAATAILAALRHRDHTGEGQQIDLALLDVAVAMNTQLPQAYLMAGEAPARLGNANPISAPSDVYACADGMLVVVAGNDGQFGRLCSALELPALPLDPRFCDNPGRTRHRAALDAVLRPAFAARPRAHWRQRLEAAGVPCGPILSMAEVFDDAQVRHRQLHLTLRHAALGEMPAVRNPIRLSATPVVHRPAPGLGEHTGSICRMLGATDEDLARWRAQGLIGGAPDAVDPRLPHPPPPGLANPAG